MKATKPVFGAPKNDEVKFNQLFELLLLLLSSISYF